MDARRRADGLLVAIKSVTKNSQEVQISRFLTSLQHPENHCVPVYDVLDDPLDPSHSLMVMQYLRPFDDPDFVMFGEVVDFVTQMLEVSAPNWDAKHTILTSSRDWPSYTANVSRTGSVCPFKRYMRC